MTNTTTSPSATRLPVMVCSPKSAGNFSRMARWMASIPVPSLALTMMGGCPQLAFYLFCQLCRIGACVSFVQKQYDRDASFFQSLKPFLFLCVSGFHKATGRCRFFQLFSRCVLRVFLPARLRHRNPECQ